jgi:tetratricopeptide (TPR) repeat protein
MSSLGKRSVASCLIVAACFCFSPATALAGKAESETFFANGRELRLAGKCAEAIPEFRRALETYPDGLGALRNIAECEEELGRVASARRSWWDLRFSALSAKESKYDGWAQDAEQAYERLGPKVPYITIKVKSAQKQLKVLVNGRPLDPQLIGTELAQDIGEVSVVLVDGSAVPPAKTIKLEAGERKEVELISLFIPKEGDDKGQDGNAGGNKGGGSGDSGGGPSPLVIGGAVGLGLAGAALVGFGAALGIREGALSTVEEQCPTLQRCDPALEEDVSQGQTASTLVNVFGIGAGVAGAAGIGLLVAGLVTAPTDSKETKPAPVAFNVWGEPGRMFLSLTGSFQ